MIKANVLGLALFSALLPAHASSCPEIALVLAIDSSGSVDSREYNLQLDGIAAAFRDERVQGAIADAGLVVVSAVLWADATLPVKRLDWVKIDSAQSAERLASTLESMPRSLTGNTALGKGLDASLDLLSEKPCARRRLINVSSDGSESAEPRFARKNPAFTSADQSARGSSSPMLAAARARAEAMGVTINGLVIANAEPWLARYYERSVIVGNGAFVMSIGGYEDFASAFLVKLLKELEPNVASAPGSRSFYSAGLQTSETAH
jgi:hypothetical protein